MASETNVGYASLQVIPVIGGIGNNLATSLGVPFQRAGERAGQMAGRGIASGISGSAAQVQAASEKVAKARETEMAASAKVRIEEAKLQELKDKGITGGSRWLAAQEKLRVAQDKSVRATRDARTAAEQLTDAQRDAANATDELEEAADGGGSAMADFGDKLKDALTSLEGVAVMSAAAGAAITAGIAENLSADVINDKLAASLGADPTLAKEYGKSTANLYRQGFGESMEDVSTAIGVVQSSFYTLGFEGEASMETVTGRAMTFAQVFDGDVTDSVQTVSQLINQGLVKDSTEGFDLLTTAFQRVPAAMRDELPEILQEYGVSFNALGFSGEEAFSALVIGAQKGKFSLDKTGDALKEFTILGSDMSESSTGVYEKLGLDAQAMSDAVAAGGAGAQDALQQVSTKLLEIESPAERANAAIALFGSPLEDLSVDQIPVFLESISGGENAMEGFAGSADKMGATLNDNATAKFEAFKRALQGSVTDALQNTFVWITDHIPLLRDLGIVVGAVTVLLLAMALQQQIMAAGGFIGFLGKAGAATKAWAAQQAILSIVMNANPIFLIITAIAALVAGIVIAYRNSETFRNFMDKLWGGIKDGAAMVWDFISPVFDAFVVAFKAIGDAAMWLWNNAITPAFDGIKFAVSVWWAAVQIYWELLKLAWKAIETAALFLWHNVIEPVFDGIKFAVSLWWAGVQIYWELLKSAWNVIAGVAMWLWHNIIEPAFNGIGAAISFMWNSVVSPIFGFFKAGFDTLGNAASWLWNTIIVPAFDGIKGAISTAWDFIRPILDKIGVGIGAVGDIAVKIGDSMKTAFDGVVDVIKAPIHAIGKLLTAIPKDVFGVDIPGVGTLHKWGETLQALRSGGVVGNGLAGRTANGQLWGPGTGTSDSILGVDAKGIPTALVSNKEGVVKADAMANGGAALVAALNSGWTPSSGDLHAMFPGMDAFADGGVVGTYGLRSPSDPFPDWVTQLGAEYNLDPSTYAGHQSGDRGEPGYAPNPEGLNRGIDWTGPVADMQRFAADAFGMAPSNETLEQVIWQNPETGEKIGWHGRSADDGSYFAADYAGHQDHVHTRQSGPFGANVEPPKPKTIYNTDTPEYQSPDYGAMGDSGATAVPGTSGTEKSTRLKSFKELGSDMGGILAEGIGETLGLPSWIMDPQGYLDSNTDTGDSVRTTDDAASTGNKAITQAAPEAAPAPEIETAPPPEAPARTGADLYAYEIARAALDKGLGREGATIGEAAALVEVGDPLKMFANSGLPASLNLPHDAVGNNGSSTGLFQQQDFPEWGTLEQRMNPYDSAGMFFDHFPADWQSMDPGAVAQAVQRSAFPDKYGQMMDRASELVNNTGLFDTGGILKPKSFAYNALSEPELIVKKHQWGVMDRNAAVVEDMVRSGRGGTDHRLAETVNIQGYTMEEVATEWRAAQWNRTAGYGTSRNR